MIYILGPKQFLLCTSVMKEVQYAYGHASYFMEAYASLLLTTEAHQHTATQSPPLTFYACPPPITTMYAIYTCTLPG